MSDAYDKARGVTRGFLDYFEPLFKAVGITLAALAFLGALYVLIMIMLR